MLEFFDPARTDFVQWHRVQVVALFPPLPNDDDEVGTHQQLQVLRDGLARHVHVLAERRERLAVVLVQLVEQAPAGRVSQRLEDLVDVLRRGFVG